MPKLSTVHTAVAKAVASGELSKPDRCEQCRTKPPKPRLLHAHHEDYSKPLDVEWLCPKCHRSRHPIDRSKPTKRVSLSLSESEIAAIYKARPFAAGISVAGACRQLILESIDYQGE